MAEDLDKKYSREEDLHDEEELLRKIKRTRRIHLIVGFSLALTVILLAVFFGKSKIGEKVRSEMPPEIEPSMAAPDWVEAEMVDVQIASDPAGARVVVNGLLHEGVTPAQVKFATGGANSVMLFLDNHEPHHAVIAADAPFSASLNFKLEPTPAWEPPVVEEQLVVPTDANGEAQELPPPPVDPRYGKLVIKAENPQDNGASVWVDGVLVGKIPVEVEQLRRSFYHHVLVKGENKAPFVAVFRMTQDIDMISLSLKDGVYLDRVTDVWVEPRPKDVQIHIGDKQVSGGLSDVVSKGKVVLIQSHLEGFESWQTTVHTTGAGQFFVRPSLSRPIEGRSLVHWKVPEGKYWYPCLKKPRASVCWDSDKLREPREIESGTYEVVTWEQVGNNVRDKRYATNKPNIVIEPDKAYSFDLNLESKELVLGGTEGVAYDSENPDKAYKALKIPIKDKAAKK